MKALISVIIPVYNAARYLRRCLDSLVGQTYRELEIICVDDGSKDDSGAILDEYAARDARIKVIHQENAGVSVARNNGLASARGEFVTFADADDWVEPSGYERAVGDFEDGVDVVCYGSVVGGSAPVEEKEAMQRYLNDDDESCKASKINVEGGGMNGCVWNKMFRRSVLDAFRVRFYEGIAYGEDVAFCYCVAGCARRVVFISDSIYHYEMHAASATGSSAGRSRRVFDHMRIVPLVWDFLQRCCLAKRRKLRMINELFHYAHGYVESRIGEELRDEADSLAYEIMCRVGLSASYESSVVRRLLAPRQGEILGRFRWFVDNRMCFGVPGRALLSVTYEEHARIYRLMGVTVWKTSVADY